MTLFNSELMKKIKACMEAVDCQPDFCLDLFEPSGHGRRRRSLADNSTNNHSEHDHTNSSLVDFTKFKENIEYSVLMPGEFDQLKGFQDPDQCKNFVLISGLLALLLTLSTILVWEHTIPFEFTIQFILFHSSFSVMCSRLQNSIHQSENHWRLRAYERICGTRNGPMKMAKRLYKKKMKFKIKREMNDEVS